MITQTLYLSDLPHKHKVTAVQAQGYASFFQRGSGYGRKLRTSMVVQLPGSKRWRRVYCACYSNAGTCYVEDTSSEIKTRRRNWIVIA